MYLLRGFTRAVLAVAIMLAASAPAFAAERYCDASHEDCRTPLLDLIRAETQGIDVAFWFMEDARYSQLLIDKWKAKVPVRIIMDTEANGPYPGNAPIVASLKAAGLPMIEKTTGGIVHWKTMIFHGQNKIEFSGANFSPDAFVPTVDYADYVDEVIYFSDDPALVNSFKSRFDDVWTATSGYTNYNNAPAPRVRRNDPFPIDSQLNFPPFNNFATRSVSAYNAEKTAIDAIMFRITDRRHSDALIAALGRGIPVRLITEMNQYRDPVRMWHSWNVDRLYMAGVQIRVRAHEGGGMHQKTTLLRSQAMTIFGSSNWTSPSATSQLEHNIFTKKPLLYQFMSDLFERKWTNATGIAETKPFVPLPPDAPTSPSPAVAAQGVATTVTLKWNGGYYAHIYDIYFGTSSNPPLFAANKELGPSDGPTDMISFQVTGLQPGTQYYWKIVSKTMANMTKSGPVWNFRTEGGTAPSAGEGDVVLHAGKASRVSGKWTVTADSTAASGLRIATIDAALTGTASGTAPDWFEMTFKAEAGVPYRLWMRGRAQGSKWANDSAYVQFSDSVSSAGAPTYRIGTTDRTIVTIEDCSGCGLSGWGWNDNASGTAGSLGPLIYFANSGDHTIRVLMREDGLSLDQIVLSRSAYLSAAPGATKDDGTILTEAGGTATGTPPPPPPPPLPAGWQSQDIGSVGKAGSGTGNGTAFTVTGAGADVWGTADAFHYVYQTLSGDGTITARVAAISGTQSWTKVGVMIRGTTSASSAHAFMLVSTSKGLAFQRRTQDGGLSVNTAGGTDTAPRWVRLQRSGNLIVASVSSDGSTWTTVDSDNFVMPSTVLIGLAVSSHTTTATATGNFDNVTIQ